MLQDQWLLKKYGFSSPNSVFLSHTSMFLDFLEEVSLLEVVCVSVGSVLAFPAQASMGKASSLSECRLLSVRRSGRRRRSLGKRAVSSGRWRVMSDRRARIRLSCSCSTACMSEIPVRSVEHSNMWVWGANTVFDAPPVCNICHWIMSPPYLQKPGQQPWRGPFRQALGPESPASHWIRTWRLAENPCPRPSGWTEGRSGRSERSPYGFQHWTKCRISPSEPVMELKAIKLRAWKHGRVNHECPVFKCLPSPGRCLIWAAWPGRVGWVPGILGFPWQTLQPPSLQEWSTERKIPISPDSNALVLTQARHLTGRP